MKKKFFLFAAALCLFSLKNTFCNAGFNVVRKEIKLDGLTRVYRLQIPDSYDGKRPVPLLFVLHGGGGTGERMLNFTGFGKVCEKNGFIAVYPDAYMRNWNDARNFLSSSIDDVRFFRVMIEQISNEYRIDTARIYAAGISNGAMMSFTLACRLSDRFAAIAAVAGNLPERLKQEKPKTPVSVLIMNGTDDPLVPYNGGSIRAFGRERGRVLSTDETVRFWIKANGCNEKVLKTIIPDRTKHDGSTVMVELYKNPLNNVEVVLYKIEGGGHTWPGGIQYLPERVIGKTNRDIKASDVIWDFFQKHKKETE